MNYHYIDYMTKERRRMEMEECRRIQLLKAAGYGRPALTSEIVSLVKNRVKLWRSKLISYVRRSGQRRPEMKGC